MRLFPLARRPRLAGRCAAAVAAVVLAARAAWALEPFTVQDIRIEGLQRVEPGTVFASIPLRVGEQYDDEKGAAAIRALFALGLFTDIRLQADGNVLIVIVEERPSIAAVEFAGTREFDKETLQKAMRDVGLAEGRPFDRALADRAEQELKRQYINRSLYGAEVVTTVTPIERNRVNLTFTVTEGEAARITDIRITGNQAFSESSLLDLFDQNVGNWLSWYTKSDRYASSKLQADLETLRSYYLQRGYLEFRVESTQVAISPDKRSISLTINVHEGQHFIVSDVQLQGNYLERDEEFKSLVTIQPGAPYNAEQVQETVQAFTEHFGNFGFAFAQVEAEPQIDRGTGRVALVLRSAPARRVYVRRINIRGNERTRDEVIRREFRQYEASWYDGAKIRLSRDRVDRLGFFTEVHVETQEVPGAPDQVDLVLSVVEKPTTALMAGLGFSQAEKVSLSFSVQQENLFGSGNYLGVDVNTSKYRRTLVLSTTDPYFTENGISRTYDLYYRTDRPYYDDDAYQIITSGASVRLGVPFSETDTVYFGGGVENSRVKEGRYLPAAYKEYSERYGYSNTALPLTVGWSRDSRDSALAPNAGRYQRLNSEWSVAGDARYLRANYQIQQYLPLSKRYTLAFNGEIGWGAGLNGRPFPLFKNFFAGGLGSVRGFEQASLGPRDASEDLALGGAKKITLNAEFMVPFPGAGNDRTLRMFGFADVGNVYGASESVNFGQMRASTGVGISWISPMGPLRLAFAHPVRKRAGDRIQRLQFQIGTAF